MATGSSWGLALALVTTLAGCDGETVVSALSVQIIDPAGDNPVEGVVSGTARFDIRQGDQPLRCDANPCSAPIEDGDFQLDVPILSFDTLTTIQVRLDGGVNPLLGAVPGFVIANEGFDTGELPVRVVVGAPATCRTLTLDGIGERAGRVKLAQPVEDAGVAIRRNQALLVGGEASGEPSSQVVFLDQVVMRTVELDPLASPIGATRGLTISEDQSLYAGSGVWRFEPRMGPVLPVAQAIPGASARSALVPRGLDGAVVIGGEASSTVVWLDELAVVSAQTQLVAPRTDPVAAQLAAGVLVVGGAETGAPTAEWLVPEMDGTAIAGLPEGHGGFLIPSPGGRSALWLGAVQPDGSVSGETYLIRGCPDCEVTAGPRWDDPRPRAASTRAGDVTWVIGGEASRAIDRVRWDGDAPVIERVDSLALETARAGATAFAHAAGIVTVVGGRSDDGLRDDIELCFPEELDPI